MLQKSVMHVQSCCFAYKTYCYFDVLVAIASLDLKVPNENQIVGVASRRGRISVNHNARFLTFSLVWYFRFCLR